LALLKHDTAAGEFAGRTKLELSFSTAQVREICEKRKDAMDALGAAAATELAERLADIDAMGTAAELMELFSGDLERSSADEFALLLRAGYRVVMRSGHPKRPATTAGTADWSKVTRLRIVAIEARNA
jgi:hypothetical protein